MHELSISQTLAEMLRGLPDDSQRIADGIAALILEYEFAETLPNGSSESGWQVQDRLRRLIQDVERLREFEHASAGLRADLEALGFRFRDLKELGVPGVGDARALPVLLHWLPLLSHPGVRSRVLIVLHSKWARPDAIEPLLHELRRLNAAGEPRTGEFAWQFGVVGAIGALVDQSRMSILMDIARNPANGQSRMLAIRALPKFRSRRAEVIDFMFELLQSDDPTLFIPAAKWLAAWKVRSASGRIQQLLDTVDDRPFDMSEAYPEEIKESERSLLKAALREMAKG